MQADLTAELPLPQRLALSYAPSRVRMSTAALLALDARLARILRTRREPIAAQLGLAWWRDVLARPVEDWPRGEPVLDALRTWHDPSGLSGLAVGWEALLAEALTQSAVDEFAAGRAGAFACLAREIGAGEPEGAAISGRLWAIADLAAHVSDGQERGMVIGRGRGLAPPGVSASLRPLAVLAGLSARALRRGGVPLLDGPGSALLALRIGLTGR